MIEFPLNANVECADGPGGQSVTVIVDPKTEQVTHLVVRTKDLSRTQRLVPVEYVESTTHDLIRLTCTRANLAEMEPFIVTSYVEKKTRVYPGAFHAGEPTPPVDPPADVEAVLTERVPAGKLAVDRGMEVVATDGWVGRVDQLLLDAGSGRISHFVMRKGHLWGQRDVVLSTEVIDHVSEKTIHLKLDKQTVASRFAVPVSQRQGSTTTIELLILTLEGTGKAGEALQMLKQSVKQGTVQILNAAVLLKDEDGKTLIKESEDVDARHGALFGALTGGLVGLLGGPVGAVVGAAAGAATGRAAAKRIDMGFPDEYLKKLQDNLQPGSSALVVMVEREWVEKVSEALVTFEGQLLRQTVTEEVVDQLTDQTQDEA